MKLNFEFLLTFDSGWLYIIYMKKLILILLPFLFLGCKTNLTKHNFYIENNSSVTVSFTTDDTTTVFTLAPNESTTIPSYAYLKPSFINHPRVYFDSDYDRGIIKDKPFYLYKIYNLYKEQITVIEENGNLGENYGESINISGFSDVIIKIYTTEPKLIAVETETNVKTFNFSIIKL